MGVGDEDSYRTQESIKTLAADGTGKHSYDWIVENLRCMGKCDLEVNKYICEAEKNIWNDQQRMELVNEYFDISRKTSGLYRQLQLCFVNVRVKLRSIGVALKDITPATPLRYGQYAEITKKLMDYKNLESSKDFEQKLEPVRRGHQQLEEKVKRKRQEFEKEESEQKRMEDTELKFMPGQLQGHQQLVEKAERKTVEELKCESQSNERSILSKIRKGQEFKKESEQKRMVDSELKSQSKQGSIFSKIVGVVDWGISKISAAVSRKLGKWEEEEKKPTGANENVSMDTELDYQVLNGSNKDNPAEEEKKPTGANENVSMDSELGSQVLNGFNKDKPAEEEKKPTGANEIVHKEDTCTHDTGTEKEESKKDLIVDRTSIDDVIDSCLEKEENLLGYVDAMKTELKRLIEEIDRLRDKAEKQCNELHERRESLRDMMGTSI